MPRGGEFYSRGNTHHSAESSQRIQNGPLPSAPAEGKALVDGDEMTLIYRAGAGAPRIAAGTAGAGGRHRAGGRAAARGMGREDGLPPFELGALARRALRYVVPADENFEMAIAAATGIFEQRHQATCSSTACTSTGPSASAQCGSNWLPRQRSISCTASAGESAGRWVCGCVIES